MNYKGILTEEAAEQFKKEGAEYVVITLFKSTLPEEDSMIREIEVQIQEDRFFAIAARNVAAEAAMNLYFNGHTVDGEKWFPFGCVCTGRGAESLLNKIAKMIGVDSIDLKWMFINDR